MDWPLCVTIIGVSFAIASCVWCALSFDWNKYWSHDARIKKLEDATKENGNG